MNNKLTFRPMTQDDADAVAAIEEKSFAMPWSREDFWREAQNELATYIVGELIKAVKARGAKAITLEVRPSNTAAIKLYENFGLKSVGRRKGYYLDNGEDALIMWNTRL